LKDEFHAKASITLYINICTNVDIAYN